MTMHASNHNDKTRAFEAFLATEGMERYFPLLTGGGGGAVQLQHVMKLKERARRGPASFDAALAELGVASRADRDKLATMLLARLEAEGGLRLKPQEAARAETAGDAWRSEVADDLHGVPPDDVDDDDAAHVSEPTVDDEGNAWPAGMRIVNGHLAKNLRAQGMLQSANDYGYIHLAAEIERPSLLRKTSARKASILASLKVAARLLADHPDVQRADVFDAFVIPVGSKEGRRVLDEGNHDVHVAEFDVVVLVECADVEAAAKVREGEAFAAVKQILDDAASFVHCITASNPKRIAEVDKTRDGVFLFNYFFAADVDRDTPSPSDDEERARGIDILLAVWEYTAGWWTAKANLTNSTPLQPVEGELSQYSLINHCRWDSPLDIVPSLVFRPTLTSFVLKNFTANNIMAMPVLYRLA